MADIPQIVETHVIWDVPENWPKVWWNCRVIRRRHCHDDGSYEDMFDIHEVHYERQDGEVKITSWTSNPCPPTGDCLEDLRLSVELYVTALNKPVLTKVEIDGMPTLVVDDEND